jgi:hypothetical protein
VDIDPSPEPLSDAPLHRSRLGHAAVATGIDEREGSPEGAVIRLLCDLHADGAQLGAQGVGIVGAQPYGPPPAPPV